MTCHVPAKAINMNTKSFPKSIIYKISYFSYICEKYNSKQNAVTYSIDSFYWEKIFA